jgi:hypothetical protein
MNPSGLYFWRTPQVAGKTVDYLKLTSTEAEARSSRSRSRSFGVLMVAKLDWSLSGSEVSIGSMALFLEASGLLQGVDEPL